MKSSQRVIKLILLVFVVVCITLLTVETSSGLQLEKANNQIKALEQVIETQQELMTEQNMDILRILRCINPAIDDEVISILSTGVLNE